MPPLSRVHIHEVSPRDGLQNEPTVVPTAAKAELIARLVDAGVEDIEVTSFVRRNWIPQLADAAELVAMLPKLPNVRYWGLVPNRVGLERAQEAGIRHIATFLSASETHNQKNVNRTVRESLLGIEEVIAAACAEGMRVRGYISAVWGCPYEGHVPVEASLAIAERLLAAGAASVVLGDTVGMGVPSEIRSVLERFVRAGIPLEKIGVHFHDTRGMAVANAAAAWEAGIGTFDGSVAGIGGCPYAPGAAGNAGTEDLVYLFSRMGVETGVSLERLAEAGGLASELLGRVLPGRYHQYHRGASQRPTRRAVG